LRKLTLNIVDLNKLVEVVFFSSSCYHSSFPLLSSLQTLSSSSTSTSTRRPKASQRVWYLWRGWTQEGSRRTNRGQSCISQWPQHWWDSNDRWGNQVTSWQEEWL